MVSKLTRIARWLNAETETALPPLIFMTDADRIPDPVATIKTLPRDTGVIFRHYHHLARFDLAKACHDVCRHQHRYFAVAGDWRMALRLKADGVHLPEGLLHVLPRLRQAAPHMTVTTSAHSLKALLRAAKLGADAAFISPIFATASHPGAPSLGAMTLAAWSQQTHIPLYALGGINETSVNRLIGTGAAGVAAIGALLKND